MTAKMILFVYSGERPRCDVHLGTTTSSSLQGVQTQPLSLDEKCEKLEEIIQSEATRTRSVPLHTAEVNEEKNTAESEPSLTTSEEPRMLTN
jgi:hypothetical protein